MHVLVIDDSRAMRSILARLLAPFGATVAQAGDGQEGLARLAEGPAPDVVFVDWNMPVMNGLEFVTALRASPANADIKVMMITTEADASHMRQALAAGADEYVFKPFTPDTLVDKLRLLGFDVPPAA